MLETTLLTIAGLQLRTSIPVWHGSLTVVEIGHSGVAAGNRPFRVPHWSPAHGSPWSLWNPFAPAPWPAKISIRFAS